MEHSLKLYFNEADHDHNPPELFICLFKIKVKAKNSEDKTPKNNDFFIICSFQL